MEDVLFYGHTNNNGQLKAIMDVKGKMNKQTIKAGTEWKKHFDPTTFDFLWQTHDNVGKPIECVVTSFPAKTTVLADRLVNFQSASKRLRIHL